jgi:hypothetical protein
MRRNLLEISTGTANDQALYYALLCIVVIITVVSNAGENIYTIHELSHLILEGGVISGCRDVAFCDTRKECCIATMEAGILQEISAQRQNNGVMK